MKRPVTSLAVADWNLTPDQVEAIARRADGDVLVGAGVDNAILVGGKVRKVLRLGRHGSDHGAILFVVELPDGTIARVLWWNVYVGQQPNAVLRTVAELVDQYQPHIVALCEAYRCRRVLRTLPGYRAFQGRPGRGRESERGDVAVLVRRDLAVEGHGIMCLGRGWTGPKHDLPKGPRRLQRVRVRFPSGARLRLLAGHGPTGGYDGRNVEAVREYVAVNVQWLRRGR